MIPLLEALLALAAVVAAEVGVAAILAGRGHRHRAAVVAAFANLTFEPLHSLFLAPSDPGMLMLIGLLLPIVGEAVAYGSLTRLRPIGALVIAVLANLMGGQIALLIP